MICYLEKKEDYKKPVDKKKYVKTDREMYETDEESKTIAKMKNKTRVNVENKIREEFAKKKHAKKEKVDREFELLEIRQLIYAKLSQGMNVDSMLRTFTMKVDQYLEKYTRSLTEYQEKTWKDKVIITEKAVIKSKIKEIKTRCKVPASYADEVDTVAEDIIEEARCELVTCISFVIRTI